MTKTEYSTLHVKAKLLHFKSCAISFLAELLKGLFPSDTAPVALCGKLESLYIIHPTKNPEAGPLWRLFSNWSPDAGDMQCSKSP